jgi:hypothetical protein
VCRRCGDVTWDTTPPQAHAREAAEQQQ